MAVHECPGGLGEQWCAGVRGIRNAWVRGSIPRGGSTLQPSKFEGCSAQAVKLSGGSGAVMRSSWTESCALETCLQRVKLSVSRCHGRPRVRLPASKRDCRLPNVPCPCVKAALLGSPR
jgi:hypothetical protein